MISNCSILQKNSPCYFISHINLQKSFPRDFNINQLEVVEINHRPYRFSEYVNEKNVQLTKSTLNI